MTKPKRKPAYLIEDQANGNPRGFMLPRLWAEYRTVGVACVCASCNHSWLESEQRSDNVDHLVRRFDYCSRCPKQEIEP